MKPSQDCPQLGRYADDLVEARKAKQLQRAQALDLLQDLNMFGARGRVREGLREIVSGWNGGREGCPRCRRCCHMPAL